MADGTPGTADTEDPPEGSWPAARGLRKVLAGFREFVARGNAIELAVGVVIGAAFSGVVTALQDGFISPLIGWIFGQPSLKELWHIGPFSWQKGTEENPIEPLNLGLILDALVQFLITAAAIYFLIVLPLNAWASRRSRAERRTQEAAAAGEEAARQASDAADAAGAAAGRAAAEQATAVAEQVALLREIRTLLAERPVPPTPPAR